MVDSIHSDAKLFCSEYCVYINDRSEVKSVHKLGRGVLVAIKTKYISELLTISATENIEMLTVEIYLHNHNLFICYNVRKLKIKL